MEDIERLKKISEMSRQLQKHGIAVDSEDAMRQSEQIYQGPAPDLHVGKNLEVECGVEVSEEEESTMHTAADNSEFHRHMNSSNDRMNNMEKQVSQFVTKMNEIIKAINKIEARLEADGVAELPKESQTTISKPEEKPKETQAQNRAGEYQPGDVEIDRIFYYGNR